MGKHLVIVESPAKAKTINKILGKDYVVKASMGHVRDLPEKKLGVDVEHGFKPDYVSIKGRQSVLKELKTAAKTADSVYLAPDPDREGEAIAWHLQHALAKDVPEDRFYRVTYNEITASAIRQAFANPGRIDMHRVDSQQARRVLDRLVGYQVSPLLWRRIRGSRSAGRVQSVALRLVCEREKEILAFVPEEYWILGAKVGKQVDPRDPFLLRLAKIDGEKPAVGNTEQAEAHLKDLDDRDLAVTGIIERKIKRKAPPPFITSTLQQAASSVFSFTPARTMRIAQRLYEGMDFGEGPEGLITYMRTDSVSISAQARDACRAYVGQTFGSEYVPEKPNVYRSRGGAQEAHEAIRPTDVLRTPDEMSRVLKPDEHKLYRLIWQRFVASQMEQAVINQRTVEVEPAASDDAKHSYLFRATTSEVAFAGYMKATGQDVKKKKVKADQDGAGDGEDVETLPPLAEGESLDLKEWLKDQKFTQPPARFSEASLVRALEENGVGRPSTYAQILSTLDRREYVEKEKRSLKPTDLGMKVNDFLVGHLGDLFDVGFTAQMEESLDEIERGGQEWTGMLDKFYENFQKWLEQVKGPDADNATVERLLSVLEGVTTWKAPVKRGNRTYSDEKFVASITKQLADGKKAVSNRQLVALVKIVARYHEQLPPVGDLMEEIGMTEVFAEESAPKEPPRDETVRKLDLLKGLTFEEPRKVGKRTYDDAKFSTSLRDQVEGGKRLSENQVRYLDQLVRKYAEQIPDFEARAAELGLDAQEEEDHESGPLLEVLGKVGEWNPPVQRGKREWDDQKFFESLKRQFTTRKSLSPKQRSALKKLCGRYADRIPDYEAIAPGLGLPPKKEKARKKKDDAVAEG